MLDEDQINGDAAFDGDDQHPDPTGPEAGNPGSTVLDGDAPEGEAKVTDLRALAGGKAKGTSVSDRHDDGEGEEETEMFPVGSLEGDSKFTLLSVFKKRHKFRVKSKIKAVAVPMTGDGMLNPEGHTNVVVTNRLSKITAIPEFDDRGQVIAWDVVQEFLPTHVEKMDAALPDTATG